MTLSRNGNISKPIRLETREGLISLFGWVDKVNDVEESISSSKKMFFNTLELPA